MWEENLPALNLFLFLRRQWRIGSMGGVIGLDYNVLYRELDDLGLTGDDRRRMKEDISVMERAALEVLNKQGT